MVNYSSKFGPTGGESDDVPARESFVALAGGSYVASHDNLLGAADLGPLRTYYRLVSPLVANLHVATLARIWTSDSLVAKSISISTIG